MFDYQSFHGLESGLLLNKSIKKITFFNVSFRRFFYNKPRMLDTILDKNSKIETLILDSNLVLNFNFDLNFKRYILVYLILEFLNVD